MSVPGVAVRGRGNPYPALALTLALTALGGCTHPLPGAAIERPCGRNAWLWRDAAGHHWIGIDNDAALMNPIADDADLNLVCDRVYGTPK